MVRRWYVPSLPYIPHCKEQPYPGSTCNPLFCLLFPRFLLWAKRMQPESPQNIVYPAVHVSTPWGSTHTPSQGPRLDRRGHCNSRATWGLWETSGHKPFSTCCSHHGKWLSPGTLPRVSLGPEVGVGGVAAGQWARRACVHQAHWMFTAKSYALRKRTVQRFPTPARKCWRENTANQNSNQKTSSRFSGMMGSNMTDHTPPLSEGITELPAVRFSFSSLWLMRRQGADTGARNLHLG